MAARKLGFNRAAGIHLQTGHRFLEVVRTGFCRMIVSL